MFSAGLSIHVIDPLNRTGKVAIPTHLVSDTKGLDDYRAAIARQEPKDFSLCLLFQKGRCNASSRCHQIHACPTFVAELRTKAASVKCCCAEHGDLHSHGYAHAPQFVRLVETSSCASSAPSSYPLSSFARTACLDGILRNVRASSLEVIVPSNKVCRLHTQRRCKFGKDCKNVHLCPDAVATTTIATTPATAAKFMIDPSSSFSKTRSGHNTKNIALSTTTAAVSIDFNCGISNRSVVSSESAGSSKQPSLTGSPSISPRVVVVAPPSAVAPPPSVVGGPLSIDCDDDLGVHHHVPTTFSAAHVKDSQHRQMSLSLDRSVNGCSSLWGNNDESSSSFGAWGGDGSLSTAALDLSAFEETMKTLCSDLGNRTDFSPAFAHRVHSILLTTLEE